MMKIPTLQVAQEMLKQKAAAEAAKNDPKNKFVIAPDDATLKNVPLSHLPREVRPLLG